MASDAVNRPVFALTFDFQRQKQYFEQRKRQQQHHIAGLESYTDGVSLLGQDNKEQRSLDVLSLLNLSSIAQECKTRSNGASSGYQVEIVPPKSDADRHNNAFNGKGDKPDNWKTATEHQLSVFDLLGDDGPYGNLEGSPVCEAHVAFSVEGLGKVGTETPVHSPHQPHRMQGNFALPRILILCWTTLKLKWVPRCKISICHLVAILWSYLSTPWA
uniref:Uncharacterized protein n=1 Tax=Vitis vinifera TaxID=29760 RepID=F6GUB0_VITVI